MLHIFLPLAIATASPQPITLPAHIAPMQTAGPSNTRLPPEWILAAGVGAMMCLLASGAAVLGTYMMVSGQYSEKKQ